MHPQKTYLKQKTFVEWSSFHCHLQTDKRILMKYIPYYDYFIIMNLIHIQWKYLPLERAT